MNTRTLASVCAGACALSTLLLTGCPSDPVGPMDTADMTQADMTAAPPDFSGAAAPVKVTGFSQPVSAFWDSTSNAWYVSNVGNPNLTDPKTFKNNMSAFISKVPANLMNPNHSWYPNTATPRLNTPFGLRGQGGKLYVGNVDKLWAIDINNPTGVAPVQSGLVAPAMLAGLNGFPAFLIDVALDAAGNIFVVDATGGRLLKWTTPFAANSQPAILTTQLSLFGASGLYIDGNLAVMAEAGINQVIMQAGGISTCNLDGSNLKRLLTSSLMSLAYQGIEKDTMANKYLIASPADKAVYYIDPATGARAVVRNVAADGAGTATDIGWDPAGRMLAVPDSGAGVVLFYKL